MKAATVGFLLGVFVCCVMCEPVPNDDTKQTAEAEYYPGPGRSRDRDDYGGRGRRGDGDYGYHHGDDGYRHHDPFYPAYPARSPLCACSRDLDPTPRSADNKCTGTGTTCQAPSSYCDNTAVPTVCPCAVTGNFGTDAKFASCYGDYNNGAGTGGAFCMSAACPSDGSLRIKGDAVPVGGGACTVPGGGCPAAVGFLYVYRGTTISPANLIGTGNQQNVDTTVSCSAGEVFQICEQNGVMITSSVKFTFTGQTTGACNMLGTGTNWVSLSCTP